VRWLHVLLKIIGRLQHK